MQHTRILYGGPIVHHWSYFWLRWMGTVRGLCIFTAAMSALAVYSFWPQGIDLAQLVQMAPVLIPVMAIVQIARHLKMREQEPGRTTPDASMQLLFELAWIFVLLILLMSFRGSV